MSHEVFISYSRKNADVAEAMVAALRARNVSVWYDKMIPGGADWREEIVKNLQIAKTLLILFSAESNESHQLKKELSLADRMDKPVLPVLIENVEPKGHYLYELAHRNWISIYPNPVARVDEVADQFAMAHAPPIKVTSKAPEPAAAPAPEAAAAPPPIPAPQAAPRRQATPTSRPGTTASEVRAGATGPHWLVILASIVVGLIFGGVVMAAMDAPVYGLVLFAGPAAGLTYLVLTSIMRVRQKVLSVRNFLRQAVFSVLFGGVPVVLGYTMYLVTENGQFDLEELAPPIAIFVVGVLVLSLIVQFIARTVFLRFVFRAQVRA